MTAKRRNRDAVERTLRALRELGRLEAIDSARVALVRSTAAALDDAAAAGDLFAFATVGRVHAAAVGELVAHGEGGSDAIEALLASLSAPVVDTSDT